MRARSNDIDYEKDPEFISDIEPIVVFTSGSGLAEHQRNVEDVLDQHIGRVACIAPTLFVDNGHSTTVHLLGS